MPIKTAIVAATAVGCLAALPATASAKQYRNYAGDPGPPPTSAPAGTELNQFFPGRMTVRKGDRIKYLNYTFHTVSILGRNEKPPGLALPDPKGGRYGGIDAPDGTPFFYNGAPRFVYNLAVFAPVGKRVVNDRGTHSSGAFGGGPNAPGKYALTFTRAGTYKVLCLLHPGMKQTVKVVGGAKKRVSSAKVATAVARQSAKAYKRADKANQIAAPTGTVYAGVEKRQSTLLVYKPESASIKAGTSLTFINNAPSEVHNMVFTGPAPATGDPPAKAFAAQHQQETDIFPPQGNQVLPEFVFGSEPQATPGVFEYSGNEYGNGFLSTQLMDAQPGDPPNGLLSTERITFTSPGTYHYYCAIHGEPMSGTVTVRP